MVSTTRKTVNTEEKAVSFSRRPSNRIYVDEYESHATERAHTNEDRVINVPKLDFTAKKTQKPKDVEYSDRGDKAYSVPKMKVYAVPTRREREDVMPTIHNERHEELKEEKSQEKQSASFHSKLMLAVYVAVVVILAAVVIGTGYAITNTSNNVANLESQLSIKNELVMEYASRLELLDDDTYNAGRGLELGMEKTDSYIEVDLVDEIIQQNYSEKTNWFDKICDFFDGLIG